MRWQLPDQRLPACLVCKAALSLLRGMADSRQQPGAWTEHCRQQASTEASEQVCLQCRASLASSVWAGPA